jgi:putative ABC transport system substrate-binding protein
MKRREFITPVGNAAAAWPAVTLAQQPAMPVVGFLSAASAEATTEQAEAFRKGLNESGFTAGSVARQARTRRCFRCRSPV